MQGCLHFIGGHCKILLPDAALTFPISLAFFGETSLHSFAQTPVDAARQGLRIGAALSKCISIGLETRPIIR